MKLNWMDNMAGTPLSRIEGALIHERRRPHLSRYSQPVLGTGLCDGAKSVSDAVVGGVRAVVPAVRLTAARSKQFWVPLCPYGSFP